MLNICKRRMYNFRSVCRPNHRNLLARLLNCHGFRRSQLRETRVSLESRAWCEESGLGHGWGPGLPGPPPTGRKSMHLICGWKARTWAMTFTRDRFAPEAAFLQVNLASLHIRADRSQQWKTGGVQGWASLRVEDRIGPGGAQRGPTKATTLHEHSWTRRSHSVPSGWQRVLSFSSAIFVYTACSQWDLPLPQSDWAGYLGREVSDGKQGECPQPSVFTSRGCNGLAPEVGAWQRGTESVCQKPLRCRWLDWEPHLCLGRMSTHSPRGAWRVLGQGRSGGSQEPPVTLFITLGPHEYCHSGFADEISREELTVLWQTSPSFPQVLGAAFISLPSHQLSPNLNGVFGGRGALFCFVCFCFTDFRSDLSRGLNSGFSLFVF